MAELIKLILSNIPIIMFVAALILAFVVQQPRNFASRLLAWMLLMSVGVEELWGGLFHVFFPHVAAASIGWQVSPFQFETGVADIAIGVTAICSFWRSLHFKAATVLYTTLVYAAVVKVVLLPTLYLMARKASLSLRADA